MCQVFRDIMGRNVLILPIVDGYGDNPGIILMSFKITTWGFNFQFLIPKFYIKNKKVNMQNSRLKVKRSKLFVQYVALLFQLVIVFLTC